MPKSCIFISAVILHDDCRSQFPSSVSKTILDLRCCLFHRPNLLHWKSPRRSLMVVGIGKIEQHVRFFSYRFYVSYTPIWICPPSSDLFLSGNPAVRLMDRHIWTIPLSTRINPLLSLPGICALTSTLISESILTLIFIQYPRILDSFTTAGTPFDTSLPLSITIFASETTNRAKKFCLTNKLLNRIQ